MSFQFRLDSISPKLAESFRQASDLQRRQAALATLLRAISQTGLRGNEVEAALDSLRGGKTNEVAIRRQISSLSHSFDDRYAQSNENAEQPIKPEALLLFRKARAAAALAFALSSEPENLHEAIYEAIIASDDQAEAIRSAMLALSLVS